MSISNLDVSNRKLLHGAAAGLLAAAPMSLSMLIGWMLLPGREEYPLSPRLIAEEITERARLKDGMREDELVGLTVFSHFGYGTLLGSVYAIFENRIPLYSSLRGALRGMALWIARYLGWLPAAVILRPAPRQPWRRNLPMIVAHLVRGVMLGEAMRRLARDK